MSSLFVSFQLSEWLWEVERLCAGGRPGDGLAWIVAGSGPGGRVAAASPEARLCGVAAGMPTAEARERCPHARLSPGRLDRVNDVLAAVHTIVGRRLPETAWLDPSRGLLSASALPPSDLQRVLDQVRLEIRDTFGLSLACGVASTRVAAEVAARLVAPSGLLHVLPGYETRVLAPVHLRWLDGLDASLLARFEAVGCRTIGDLAALPPWQADALAGGVGLVLAHLANGVDRRPPRPSRLPRRVTAFVEIPPATRRGPRAFLDGVEHALAALLAHPHRGRRRLAAVVLKGWTRDGADVRREYAPPPRSVWASDADVALMLAEPITDGLEACDRGCLSVQFALGDPPIGVARSARATGPRLNPGRTAGIAMRRTALESRRHSA